MTDRRNIGLHRIAGGVRDNVSQSRNSKVSKMKTKRRLIGLNDSQSPSCNNSYNCRKDYTTPKRRPRIRFDSCYSGDSPNETESLQDIIWDPNSPTQNFNGKEVNSKVIEISEIVNRIAPKVERPNERDCVLQWIGDNAIPCTPEIRQPRIRRISSRQSNVEDLMKLAKQFDINMTRMTTEVYKPQHDETRRVKPASVPVTSEGIAGCFSQARQEEEELQALFDGPTQHLSGRLSPPSAHCTPESITAPVAPAGPGPCSATIKKTPVDTPKATNVDFDDDWENDDLLNDSFVLEMTQNPMPLNVAQNKSIAQPVAKTHLSVSHVKDVHLQNQKSTVKSCTFTKSQTSVQGTSRVKSHAPTTEKLLKTLIQQPAQSSPHTEFHKTTKGDECSGQPSTSNFDGVSKEDLKSLFDSDALWNDEDDDDLLWQACDDVEKTSASQEQHKHSMDFTELAHNTSKATSSAGFTHAQAVNITKKSLSGETTKSTRAFNRSNSVPSSSSVFKQDYNAINPETAKDPTGLRSYQYRQAQNKLTEVKSALQPRPDSGRTNDTSLTTIPQNTRKPNPSNALRGTFKRHLSDSVTLTNKVFVSSNTTVKCSAAEIERKKQEAIARRKLRMQASQKQEAPK
ncbi:uncharacterized protein etaa1b [Misgurnus anguillicaudatus]|uniref:uncharacterized protein etaa1b n=1 Tax=Misgurnus anguillicaudatus TaxID=75329 RepID=UPI003CCF9D23